MVHKNQAKRTVFLPAHVLYWAYYRRHRFELHPVENQHQTGILQGLCLTMVTGRTAFAARERSIGARPACQGQVVAFIGAQEGYKPTAPQELHRFWSALRLIDGCWINACLSSFAPSFGPSQTSERARMILRSVDRPQASR